MKEALPMKALLVINVQNGVYTEGESHVHRGEETLVRINTLIDKAHCAGCPIVYIRHEDEELVPHTWPWESVDALKITPTALSVSKHNGSAFHDTELDDILNARSIEEIVISGMQTQFCVDSTVRHAHTLGYGVEVAADAHTTHDSAVLTARQIIDHHNATWKSYATVLASDEITFGRTLR